MPSRLDMLGQDNKFKHDEEDGEQDDAAAAAAAAAADIERYRYLTEYYSRQGQLAD
jgi:hypothetical protein